MRSSREHAPRVAVLGKARSILSWFADVEDGFRRAGAEVRPISLQTETVAERLKAKAGAGKELANREVVARTARQLGEFQPDLVLTLNKTGLPAGAAEAWRRALPDGTPMIGWICDCLPGPPTGQVPAFDGVYYFDSHSLPLIEAFYREAGCEVRCDYLPLAVNPARYPFGEPSARRPWLVFAGKCSAHRHEAFAAVRAAGLRIDLYGPGAGDRMRFWRSRRLSPNRLGSLYRGHLAVLNIPQPGNTEHGLNLRAFEIPCAGGLGTYPEVPDVARCFDPERELLVFRSYPELAARVAELQADPARVGAMVAAGRARVLRDHTFEVRARQILRDWLGADGG